MRKIEIVDDIRLRFPERDAEFDLCLEIGALTVLLAQGSPVIDRIVSEAAAEQLRPLARHFRYALAETVAAEGLIRVTLSRWPHRPALRIV